MKGPFVVSETIHAKHDTYGRLVQYSLNTPG